MDAKRDELHRLVAALSGACKQDRNVLKDGELVDALESHGRQIARLRKQQKKLKKAQLKLSMSPSHCDNKTAKKLKKLVLAGESRAAEAVPKRRKLSLDDDVKLDTHGYSHSLSASCLFPAIERQQKPKHESMDEWISSLQGAKVGSLNATDALVYSRPTTPTTVSVAVEVSEESVLIKPLKTYPYGRIRRSVSPGTVDLSASSTSTMASYYDDMYDEYAVSPDKMRRYTRSASDRTPSFESMDWTPSDDDSSDESMPFRSIEDDVEAQKLTQQHQLSRVSEAGRSVDTRLNVLELSTEGNEEYFSANEGESTAEASTREPKEKPLAASSTEVVMKVLYRIMEHNEYFKWLIDPTNQARVAKLVEYHMKEQHGSDKAMSYGEDARFIGELRAQVDQLIRENVQIQSENVRLLGREASSPVVETKCRTMEEIEKRLATTQEAVGLQEGCRREAEAAFQSELESKSRLVSSLQQDLLEKDVEIAKLLGRESGEDVAGNSDGHRTALVSKLKNTVMEKDREICRLNLQLSTKQKLVGEIAKKVGEQLESSLKTPAGEVIAVLPDDLRLDMDMFLFKSVAEKQQMVDELRAALVAMEREVSGLETRVVKKAREALVFKTKYKSLSSRLCESNVNVARIQTENARLVASLKEKQAKMRDLIEFLEGKEKQVMHLEEQVDLRQTQLEHVMTEYEKIQQQQQQCSQKTMTHESPRRANGCAREQEALSFEHSGSRKGPVSSSQAAAFAS
ncbi:hypothetical protein BBJ28_00022178 [Nothophytophthora sp. Chile5]|nr:hypothetical protein BBJ28_00022178 [Nothophytophthora sp. Chile5]